MEKDIDDLLDEVESKYVNRLKKSDLKPTTPKKTDQPTNKQRQRNTVDDAINDILDLDLEDGPTKQKPTVDSVSSASFLKDRKNATKKCFPIFLGGSNDEVGHASSVKTRSCDQLRCTDCDFRVSFFDDVSWKKETNYLFLRNNVPDFEKLKSNLRRQKGWRAYCCQCSWRNVESLQEISSDTKLKWACGKHNL